MATTTNYSWTTPDDTDLVKDGAAAIRTLGSSADTTVKNLNPGTTAGDIDYYTSSTAKARIAIGTAGQVLTVNSGATAPEWATPAAGGGLTLLSTTTLSGASTTISSISGSYKNLEIHIFGVTNATATGVFTVEPNSSNNISSTFFEVAGSSGGQQFNSQASTLKLSYSGNGGLQPERTVSDNFWVFRIYNYADSSNKKGFDTFGGYAMGDFSNAPVGFMGSGFINTTSAINALKFANTGGNFNSGTVKIYGVN